MEDCQQKQQQEKQDEKNIKKSTITIPSIGDLSCSGISFSSSASPSTSGTGIATAGSFAQAFSYIKSTEFYTPPPPPTPPTEHEQEQRNDAATVSASSSGSITGQNRNAILVSHRQKGNPLLKHIRNVKWVFADVVCDYLLGQNSCALYLSLRYHLLHPDYLYFRIRELQKNFKLRVVLCHVDVEDVVKPLLEVTRTALFHDCTLLCGWSLEECGRYLETIKVYENKSADNIREQMDNDYLSRLNHALTAVRRVNKTDVLTLGSTFGSLSCIMDASMEELARCPGIGERKVKRLYDTFHEPFRRVSRHPTISPDVPVENENPDKPCGIEDDGVQVQQANTSSSKRNDEPAITVKSALAAAFAKYSSNVNTNDGKVGTKNEGGKGNGKISEAARNDAGT